MSVSELLKSGRMMFSTPWRASTRVFRRDGYIFSKVYPPNRIDWTQEDWPSKRYYSLTPPEPMWISELLNCGRKMFSTPWRAAARVFRRDRYIFSKVYPPNQNDWTQEDWFSYWMEVRKNVKRFGVPSKRYYYSLTAPEPMSVSELLNCGRMMLSTPWRAASRVFCRDRYIFSKVYPPNRIDWTQEEWSSFAKDMDKNVERLGTQKRFYYSLTATEPLLNCGRKMFSTSWRAAARVFRRDRYISSKVYPPNQIDWTQEDWPSKRYYSLTAPEPLLNCGRKIFSTPWRAAARVFRRDRYIFSKVYPPNQNDWTQEDWLSYWMEVRKNVKRLGVPSKRYYYSLTAPEPMSVSELLNCGRMMLSTPWRAASRVFRRDRYIFSKVYPPNRIDWTQEDWSSFAKDMDKNVERLGTQKRFYYSLFKSK